MNLRIVLAYSGGLDTSAIVPWLKEEYGATVICFTGDVGQGRLELRGLRERALALGADDCVVRDLRDAFVREVVFRVLKAGAVYQQAYLLGTAMARPVLAAEQVDVAREVDAVALAHGCTGKGNDQVRFELTFQTLAPDLRVIAPWREWEMRGRSDLLRYLAARGIDTSVTVEKPFSRDRNLWHCSHEGGVLEDPGRAPPEDLFLMTRAPSAAPDAADTVEIGFEQGVPITVDGEALSPVPLLEALNDLAGRHGVGRVDLVEDRLLGMKSRGVYETPGGTVLFAAHRALEQLVLNRRTQALKTHLAEHYAQLVYDGLWWTAEREAIDAFVDSTQRVVTGTVRLQLYKGGVQVLARSSPMGLYRSDLASFEADGSYDSADAAGFIRVFGLNGRIAGPATPRANHKLVAV